MFLTHVVVFEIVIP